MENARRAWSSGLGDELLHKNERGAGCGRDRKTFVGHVCFFFFSFNVEGRLWEHADMISMWELFMDLFVLSAGFLKA